MSRRARPQPQRYAVALNHPSLQEGPVGGAAVADLSREIVRLHARLYGRGPTKARSYLHGDYAACVLEEIFTADERALIEAGSGEQVRATRTRLQAAVRQEFTETAERITGRTVRVYLNQVDVDAGLALEFFILAEPPPSTA